MSTSKKTSIYSSKIMSNYEGYPTPTHNFNNTRTTRITERRGGNSPVRSVTTKRDFNGALETTVSEYPQIQQESNVEHTTDFPGDTVVSYAVDPNTGDRIKITSTGILRSPEIKTIAERISPGKEHVAEFVYHSRYTGVPILNSTMIHRTSPMRRVKETVYGSHPAISSLSRAYSPARPPLRNFYQESQYSPSRTYQRYSPSRSGVQEGYSHYPSPSRRTQYEDQSSNFVRSHSKSRFTSESPISPSPTTDFGRSYSPLTYSTLTESQAVHSPYERENVKSRVDQLIARSRAQRTEYSPISYLGPVKNRTPIDRNTASSTRQNLY